MIDQASYDALKPVFDRAIEILTKDRGSRGLLWKRLPLSDLIALLHVKSERLCEDSNDIDSADDAINYAAMIAWRIRDARVVKEPKKLSWDDPHTYSQVCEACGGGLCEGASF